MDGLFGRQSALNKQQTLALLALLARGRQDIDAGRTRPVREVVARLLAKHGLGATS